MWRDTNKKYNGHPIYASEDGRVKFVKNINGHDAIVTTSPPTYDGVYKYRGPVLVTNPSIQMNLAGEITCEELGLFGEHSRSDQ